MTKKEMLAGIEEIGIIPAVRVGSPEEAIFASESIFGAGIRVVEITMTTPHAADVISCLLRKHPNSVLGAGTVLDMATAEISLDAGASFLTSTGLDPDITEFAQRYEIPLLPGVLTPTEIMAAKRAHARFVKVFPCASMGGPAYIRALRGPFPDVGFVASGGVTQQTATQYIRAGANILGIGKELLPPDAIRARNTDWIHELARRFISMVQKGRNGNGNDDAVS
ncbi:MAG: bifunctional 4-hydroxy-2-oxoglutarate aldolase/2-dehydro-3-deoxy-phosphogluconate aldolase [Acidobacteriaceae bacterium]|nr:bifunctional 4-hydroxy-2-oxoglutarate aldolase/2-dehydro-3-deoxy-phosphogluconate aldolase [Acidobacteriaceae bacterium]